MVSLPGEDRSLPGSESLTSGTWFPDVFFLPVHLKPVLLKLAKQDVFCNTKGKGSMKKLKRTYRQLPGRILACTLIMTLGISCGSISCSTGLAEQYDSAMTAAVFACTFHGHKHTEACMLNGKTVCGYSTEVFHSHQSACFTADGTLVCQLPENPTHVHSSDCYTSEETIICGMEAGEGAHVHTPACYTRIRESGPNCGMAETEGHLHTDTCYAPELVCTQAESAGHIHQQQCRTLKQVCPLEETDGHQHSEACFTLKLICECTETSGHQHADGCWQQRLQCTLEESSGHEHQAACYGKELICTLHESTGHQHTDACFEIRRVCGEEEREAHVHTEQCLNEGGEIICQKEECTGHAHSDLCYTSVNLCGMAEGEGAHAHGEDCYTPVLQCGKTAGEGAHTHSGECYHSVLICTIAEGEGAHMHSDACYIREQTCALPEQQAHRHEEACFCMELTCGKAEGEGAHRHTETCYEQHLICHKEPGTGAHIHSDACFSWNEQLICGMNENPGHQHTAACFSSIDILCCRYANVHHHKSSCFVMDADNRRTAVCGFVEIPEHTHDASCWKQAPQSPQEVNELSGAAQATLSETIPENPQPASAEALSGADQPETHPVGLNSETAQSTPEATDLPGQFQEVICETIPKDSQRASGEACSGIDSEETSPEALVSEPVQDAEQVPEDTISNDSQTVVDHIMISSETGPEGSSTDTPERSVETTVQAPDDDMESQTSRTDECTDAAATGTDFVEENQPVLSSAIPETEDTEIELSLPDRECESLTQEVNEAETAEQAGESRDGDSSVEEPSVAVKSLELGGPWFEEEHSVMFTLPPQDYGENEPFMSREAQETCTTDLNPPLVDDGFPGLMLTIGDEQTIAPDDGLVVLDEGPDMEEVQPDAASETTGIPGTTPDCPEQNPCTVKLLIGPEEADQFTVQIPQGDSVHFELLALEIPEKQDFYLSGWYTDREMTSLYSGEPVSDSMTLYAQWKHCAPAELNIYSWVRVAGLDQVPESAFRFLMELKQPEESEETDMVCISGTVQENGRICFPLELSHSGTYTGTLHQELDTTDRFELDPAVYTVNIQVQQSGMCMEVSDLSICNHNGDVSTEHVVFTNLCLHKVWVMDGKTGKAYGYAEVPHGQSFSWNTPDAIHGMEFCGWTSTVSEDIQPEIHETIFEDITYTARWGYRVTFTDGVEDELVFADRTYLIPEGDKTPVPEEKTGVKLCPVRDGWVFTGWKNIRDEGQANGTQDRVFAHAVYEAQWTACTPVTDTLYATCITEGTDGLPVSCRIAIFGPVSVSPANRERPFPNGSKSGTQMTELSSGIRSAIAEICFTQPGIYTYQIQQLTGRQPGYIWDHTRYHVRVHVEQEGNHLTCRQEILRVPGNGVYSNNNREVSDDILFLNTYKAWAVTYTDGVENTVIFEDQTSTVPSGTAAPKFMDPLHSVPNREGYQFAGWMSSLTGEISSTVDTQVYADIVYTAQWKKIVEFPITVRIMMASEPSASIPGRTVPDSDRLFTGAGSRFSVSVVPEPGTDMSGILKPSEGMQNTCKLDTTNGRFNATGLKESENCTLGSIRISKSGSYLFTVTLSTEGLSGSHDLSMLKSYRLSLEVDETEEGCLLRSWKILWTLPDGQMGSIPDSGPQNTAGRLLEIPDAHHALFLFCLIPQSMTAAPTQNPAIQTEEVHSSPLPTTPPVSTRSSGGRSRPRTRVAATATPVPIPASPYSQNDMHSEQIPDSKTDSSNSGQLHSLIIRYRYMDGHMAGGEYRKEYMENERYSIPSPVLPGYVCSMVETIGAMGKRNQKMTVFYLPEHGWRGRQYTLKTEPQPASDMRSGFYHAGICYE